MNYNNIFLILILLGTTFATQFGKNIVQYNEFDWYYTQTKHFDIYVSDSSGYHLEFLKENSEDAYKKIESLFNWSLRERVSIIVYPSHNDFQQTNVISSHLPEGVGGVTELLKNRVVIPFDGSLKEFQHVLYHELVHAFINDCVYGGSLKSMMANSIKARIPLWMNEGLAEYISDKWSSNSDMWIRDLVLNGENLPHINQLTGYWAYRGGQSVWNFITQKWGEESISEIINQIKIKSDVSMGLKAAIAVDIDELTTQWHKYLKKEYWPDISDKMEIQNISSQLTFHEKIGNHYNIAPSISPNGKYIAIFSDKNGVMNLFLINALNGEFIEKIITGERTLEFEELHILKPGITWSPDGEKIAVAVKSGKSDAIIFIDLESKKKDIKRFPIKGIFRPTWNPKKNLIAFIGNNGFASDIYIYDVEKDLITNYTNDWFTDDQVSWDENGESLFFISNRADYLETNQFTRPENYIINNRNLGQSDIYSINLMNKQITRHTNTEYDESYPYYSNENKILTYIADSNGINNIYMKLDSSEVANPITNILTGITQLSWNTATNQLIFTGFNNGGYDIFTIYNPIELLKQPITLTNANWKNKNNDHHKLLRHKDEILAKKDQINKYKNYIFSNISDINNENDIEIKDEISLNKNFDNLDISNSLKMFKYKNRFTLDYANMDYGYNSTRGSTGLVHILFSDILGNHKVLINTEMQIRLKSSDYLIKYYNLSKRTDWIYEFYHYGQEFYDYQEVSIGNQGETVTDIFPSIRYQSLGFTIDPKFAINKFQRINFGVDLRANSKQNIIWEDYYNYEEKADKNYFKLFLIPSVEYTFDNTLWYETYPVEGKRLSIKYLNSLLDKNSSSLNFHALTFDLRFYKSITNGVSTAIRFYGGTFNGKDVSESARFRLGGTTYLPFFNKASYSHIYDVHSFDQVYYDMYVMPLRGLPIGAKYGQQVLLMNTEIRLPFLMYYFPTISLLGKINGVLFTDIAFMANNNSIPNPFEKNSWDDIDLINGYDIYPNSTNNNIVEFEDRTVDPLGWVWTFGLGPRFILLGMPWQLDCAWQYNPIEKQVSSARWYLSIGLDF